MRFEAPPGMKPLLEFLVWELADCGSDRINVIDRKEMISKLDQVSTNYPDRPRTGRTTGSGMTGQFWIIYKMSHHYRHFCTPGVPQPITGSGRYLEFVLDMKKTQVRFFQPPPILNIFGILIGGPMKNAWKPLFFGGRGNKIKVRVTAFRGNQWKPASLTPSKNDLPLIGKK